MRKYIYLIAILLFLDIEGQGQSTFAPTPIFTWMDGSQSANEPAVYGNKGEVVIADIEIGSRQDAAMWDDGEGNLWLFGGLYNNSENASQFFPGNDLWRYNKTTRQWIWMSGSDLFDQYGVYGTKGVADAANQPGARSGALAWLGANKKLYLFGGRGYAASGSLGFLNDLWEYDIDSDRWTWISGTNAVNDPGQAGALGQASVDFIPSGRTLMSGKALADGTVLIYGGASLLSSLNYISNALWRFNPSTLEWTLLKGSAEANNFVGVFGTKGSAHPDNRPPSLVESRMEQDKDGNVWLFGGRNTSSGFNTLWKYDLSSNNWTWVSGSNLGDQSGVYGSKGIASASNMPGTRGGMAMAYTNDHRMLIFGGFGADENRAFGFLNDYWEYDFSTELWTWWDGAKLVNQDGVVPEIDELMDEAIPNSRTNSQAIYDSSKNTWLLFGGGGQRVVSGQLVVKYYNSLWELNPDFRFWQLRYGVEEPNVRVSFGEQKIGAVFANPGGRSEAAGVSLANNDLMLFGGSAANGPAGRRNDLWVYSLQNKQWIWQGGYEGESGAANYGTLGVASTDHIPGARSFHKMIHLSDEHILLFAGIGNSSTTTGYLNDLWRYNYNTGEWTWLGGSNIANPQPNYGTKGQASASNVPGGKGNFAIAKAGDGSVWIFGGIGLAEGGATGYTNDLWRLDYDSSNSTFQYTWVSGTSLTNQAGIYGEQGQSGSGNTPGARVDANLWVDANGEVYLFSGAGYDENGVLGAMNDLWKFDPSTSEWTWISGSKTANSTGFGTPNTESSTIVPTQRFAYDFWVEPNKFIWAFGGGGSSQNIFMWRYNMENQLWAWLYQSSETSNVFGTVETSSSSTRLGWRNRSLNWFSDGYLWHYGGNSFDKDLVQGRMNDLWRIDVFQNSQAPTDILLSNAAIAENNSINQEIGAILVKDPDPNETFSFEILPASAADTFAVINKRLVALVPLDFEAQAQYTFRILVRDKANLSFEKEFSVEVLDMPEAPTDILLSANTLVENAGTNIVVGTLSALDDDADESFTFQLVAGEGDTHNPDFFITGNQLFAATSFDYEQLESNPLSVRIEVSDKDALTFTKALSITILDVNDAPTNIMLTQNSVAENLPIGTLIGNFSTEDQDVGDTHTYHIKVQEEGDHHELFSIQNNQLRTEAIFNFEEIDSYEITIRSTDTGGLFIEKTFTISILDGPDAPTDILLQPSAIAENKEIGSLVGTFTTVDEDANESHSYTLVAGQGATDNALFSITDDQLFALSTFDFEVKSAYSIRVRSTDKDNLTIDKVLEVNIIDVNEAPRDILLSASSIAENQPPGTLVAVLSTVDDLLDELHVYSLVSGTGDRDNEAFSIEGEHLISAISFDFESQSSYQIRLRTTDFEGLFLEKAFVISILDLPEAPTDILLSRASVEEGQSIGTEVGQLSTIDPDDPAGTGTYTYAILGEQAAFSISGDKLRTAQVLSRAQSSSFEVQIETRDSDGLNFARTFAIEVLPLIDNTPPQISIQSLPATYQLGSNAGNVVFEVSDNYQMAWVQMLIRKLGESDFSTLNFPLNAEGNYSLALNDELMGGRGIEFIIQAADTSRNQSTTALQKVGLAFSNTASPQVLGLGVGGEINGYRMFAIPYQLEDNRIESIFERNLSPYNKWDWRLLHWNNNRYVEYKEGLSNIELGKGYWFNSQQAVSIQTGSGFIPAYSQSNPFVMSLSAGWNQIGNPYPFAISWTEVLAENSGLSGLNDLFVFRGSSTGYESTNILNSFEGAFLFSERASNLVIPPVENSPTSEIVHSDLMRMESTDWQLEMRAIARGQHSNVIRLGMGNGEYTKMQPPKFFEYFELSLMDENALWPWHSELIQNNQTRQEWRVEIAQNKGFVQQDLTWDIHGSLLPGQLLLVDDARSLVIDMMTTNTLTIANKPGEESYSLRVLYDVHGVQDLGIASLSLGDVFPNPMDQISFLPLMLPEADNAYDISIVLIDMAGKIHGVQQNVRLEAGYHHVPIEKANLAKGIYICEIKINSDRSQVFTKKIMIK